MQKNSNTSNFNHKNLLAIVFVVLIGITIVIRMRMLDAPLERDEGEYAYAGQLMLQGVAPYSQAYNMKMPGIYAAYAVILAIFGQSPTGIHFGVLVLNTATVYFIFVLGRRLLGSAGGVGAAVFFAITSISNHLEATANAENFVIFFAIGGILLLMNYTGNKKKINLKLTDYDNDISTTHDSTNDNTHKKFWFEIASSSRSGTSRNDKNGVSMSLRDSLQTAMAISTAESVTRINLIFGALLLGVAFLMKQHGAAFILFGFLYLLFNHLQDRPRVWKKIFLTILVYSFLTVLPFLITCVILWRCGVFEKFWFWTFEYARHYVSLTTAEHGMFNLHQALKRIFPFSFSIWFFALAGLLRCTFNKRFFLPSFLFFSFLSVCPGLYFRPHYFVLFLPALSLCAGAGTVTAASFISGFIKSEKIKSITAILLILAVWLQCAYSQKDYLRQTDPELISRFNFGFLPFPETLKIARYIKENSDANDKIAVFGSEPQIYFYSQRRSATSYIYTYPLMERQPFALEMQNEMISQVEENKPRYFVVVKTADSWTPVRESERHIFNWADTYINENYRQVGLVEIFKDRQYTSYRWDSIAKPVQTENWLMILERKE